MIRLQLDLSAITPLSRTQIEHLADVASRFSSRILFDCQSRTINGKSMLGLLSLGATGSAPVTLICEGDDETDAARELKRLLDSGIAPPKTSADAYALVQKIKDSYLGILGEDLIGVYLHGSLAAGCFHWEISDIDLLVVVRQSLSLEKKMALVKTLYDLTPDAPQKGIEMSVMLERDCRGIAYPAPFELHYSPMHRAAYEQDPVEFCRAMHGEDPDLTSHILFLHSYGVVAYGRSIARTFDPVRREDALAAIRADAADAMRRLHDDPCYCVLNLCRALAYLRENRALSKKDGGEWALKNLPQEHQRVIQAAVNAYESGLDMSYDRGLAENFCADALEELGIAQ
ncbi:MAG: DUF4111 domain-containing protein [Clostridia bacterium]|nr:DUF4111 domain-containing protein [Clostridia bacterium]